MSSTLELLTDALEDIGAAGLKGPTAEDIAKALRYYNQRVSNWNTRERCKRFERMQTFPVVASQASYTIGVTGDAPDFIVASGRAPVKITHGNWIVGSGATRVAYGIEVITVTDYQQLGLPGFTGNQPYGIYYQRTAPSGTLWPWPVPTVLVDALQLFWWDQFTQVLIDDVALELNLPEGTELALRLTLAEDLCIPFQKTRSPELTADASRARADAFSQNVSPPKLDTSGNASGRWLGWTP